MPGVADVLLDHVGQQPVQAHPEPVLEVELFDLHTRCLRSPLEEERRR
jgi:hypothetical protein